jgi:hypothetical protein
MFNSSLMLSEIIARFVRSKIGNPLRRLPEGSKLAL